MKAFSERKPIAAHTFEKRKEEKAIIDTFLKSHVCKLGVIFPSRMIWRVKIYMYCSIRAYINRNICEQTSCEQTRRTAERRGGPTSAGRQTTV